MAMANSIKTLVSKKKRRFIEAGYNLDLTYISDRVIAMGYPSENLESMYRNKLEDVRKLLEEKHKDHYKIYNLCSERSYDIQKFHNRVATYPFDDHNPPEFGQMKPFCEDVDKWLDEHEQNVAVVHCKAGKGRTGLMICAYLLHRRTYTTADGVLAHYGSVRTQDQKGVTIPSQRRYVDYYAAMMHENLQYNPVKMYLTSIVIDPLPQLASLSQIEGYIQFEVRQTSVRPFSSDVYLVKRTDGRINIELQTPLLIVGDVKIDFTQKIKLDILNLTGRPRYVSNGKLFHFWVNTFFIDQHRSTHLTHDSTVSAPPPPSGASGPPEGKSRSAHNSGSGQEARSAQEAASPLPPPRRLGPSLSSGDPRTREVSSVSAEPELDSCGSHVSSLQTIHGHPAARTVAIVESHSSHTNGRREEEEVAGDIKHMSISDDFLSKPPVTAASEDLAAEDATHKSFMEKRHRHSSVPQTARAAGQLAGAPARQRRHIPPGKLMSVRLNKSQIDKAAKDKSGKFSDNFNVTLFLVRPNDQTLQAEFSRSNLICQPAAPPPEGAPRFTVTRAGPPPPGPPPPGPVPAGPAGALGAERPAAESSEESSEEEAELRTRLQPTGGQVPPGPECSVRPPARRIQSSVARTLTAPLPGIQAAHGSRPVEPHARMAVSMAVTPHSTWI